MRRALSLVELLVVLLIVVLLAALLLPVLVSARETARAGVCATRQRQLVQALLLYAEDHDARLPFSFNWPAGSPEWWWTTVVHPYVRVSARGDYNANSFTGCPSATWPARLAVCPNPQVMLYQNGPPHSPHFPGTTRALPSFASPASVIVLGECGQVREWRNAPANFHPLSLPLTLPSPRFPSLAWKDVDRDADLAGWPPADPAFGQVRYRHHGTGNMAFLDGHVKRFARGSVPYAAMYPPPVVAYTQMGEE